MDTTNGTTAHEEPKGEETTVETQDELAQGDFEDFETDGTLSVDFGRRTEYKYRLNTTIVWSVPQRSRENNWEKIDLQPGDMSHMDAAMAEKIRSVLNPKQ